MLRTQRLNKTRADPKPTRSLCNWGSRGPEFESRHPDHFFPPPLAPPRRWQPARLGAQEDCTVRVVEAIHQPDGRAAVGVLEQEIGFAVAIAVLGRSDGPPCGRSEKE